MTTQFIEWVKRKETDHYNSPPPRKKKKKKEYGKLKTVQNLLLLYEFSTKVRHMLMTCVGMGHLQNE